MTGGKINFVNLVLGCIFICISLALAYASGSNTRVTEARLICNDKNDVAGRIACDVRMDLFFTFFATEKFRNSLSKKFCNTPLEAGKICPRFSKSNFKLRDVSSRIYHLQYLDEGHRDSELEVKAALEIYLELYNSIFNSFSEEKSKLLIKECFDKHTVSMGCVDLFSAKYTEGVIANVRFKQPFEVVVDPVGSKAFVLKKSILSIFGLLVLGLIAYLFHLMNLVVRGKKDVQ